VRIPAFYIMLMDLNLLTFLYLSCIHALMKKSARQIIHRAFDSGKRIRMKVSCISPKTQTRLRLLISEILALYHGNELVLPLYTCVMELLHNAVRANYKSIYFENYEPKNDPSRVIDYSTSLKLFRLELARIGDTFSKIAKEKDLNADIVFTLYDDALRISVINPLPMTPEEYRSVSRKLENATKYKTLTDYFRNNPEDPMREGAGLGLLLILVIIKNLGGNRSNFSLRTDGEMTVASILIPLDEWSIEHYHLFLRTGDHKPT
jgi:hypothetical protein